MANPAFSSTAECPIDYVERISAGLVSDCEIPEDILDIQESPFFDLPIVVPDPPNHGCWPLTTSISVEQGSDFDVKMDILPVDDDPDADPCERFIDFSFMYPPAACSDFDFEVRTSVVESDYFDVSALAGFSDCVFNLDFDFVVPAGICSEFNIFTETNQTSGDEFGFDVTAEASNCDFSFVFDFTVPDLAGFCSDFDTSVSTDVVTGADDWGFNATAEFSDCGFNFEFGLSIPEGSFCGDHDMVINNKTQSDGAFDFSMTGSVVDCTIYLNPTFTYPKGTNMMSIEDTDDCYEKAIVDVQTDGDGVRVFTKGYVYGRWKT